ncbi:hypothetical protein GCM10022222_33100 [Amycolatopsis ultiminotia]|uniref:RNA polymerase sigma factor 70 region 4 type 2 domain-containing protein n=1 Tax=Amycolatopsis ultiminotia TaxID=543629 RepID=A0ABP6W8L8_9PSEU
MTAGTREAHLGSVPAWLDGEPAVDERMLTLAHRVARRAAGRSRRARAEAGKSVVLVLSTVDTSGPAAVPGGRDARAKVLAALQARLGARVDRRRLDSAAREAVLLDELALLPPRQRYALWATALQHRSVAEVAAATGWSPAQVARLLRAALRTVAAHAQL